MKFKNVTWEGVAYRHQATDKSVGLPFKCDGCETMVHNAEVYASASGAVARWCFDCVEIVEAEDLKAQKMAVDVAERSTPHHDGVM